MGITIGTIFIIFGGALVALGKAMNEAEERK